MIEELILISGGSTNIQALLANEIRLANVAGSAPIQAKLQGGNVTGNLYFLKRPASSATQRGTL
jgi:hypothetical protein